MKTKYVAILLLYLIATACKNNRQTLGDKAEEQQVNLTELYASEEVLDTIVPNPGVKYPEQRKIDPQNPPKVINLETVAEARELDLAQYYAEVEYIKLKHPLSEKGIAFLGNSSYEVLYDQGGMMGDGANSRVYLTEDKLIAGDNFFGYHCFDFQGNYTHTLIAKKELPDFDLKNNKASLHWSPEGETIHGISVLDDNCLIMSTNNRKSTFVFHHLGTRKNYLSRPGSPGSVLLLSPDTYVADMYRAISTGREPMLYCFDIKGDTLSKFINYNPLADVGRGSYTNPESTIFYRHGKYLTMRQAYNDTIFRVTAEKLIPVYVLSSGNKKPDVQTALKGDKKGKIFISKLLETDDFLFITHTEDYDCRNNRNSGAVRFFYSYFDKNAAKRYALPRSGFPAVFTLTNSIDGTIPVSISNASVYKNKFYSSYTKRQLSEIISSDAFAAFPAAQRAKLQSLHSEMTDFELLVMILK